MAWSKPVALSQFPVKGKTVTQGYGGDVSHNNQPYSVDFRAGMGDAYYSMGGGKVVYVDRGGQRSWGNFVTILHDGSVYATYAHFGYIKVNVGDTVVPGTYLGDVGNTGFIKGVHAHVHFGTKITNGVADGSSDGVPPAFFPEMFGFNQSHSARSTDVYGTSGDDGEQGTPDNFGGTAADNRMYGGAGNDILKGYGGHDELRGGQGDDRLYGGDHNDKLYGAEENDILYGDSGDDYLEGGAGKDILYGGAGRDILIGGSLKDELTGGSGADTFRFELTLQSPKGSGRDIIRDFSRSDGDRIDLSNIDANEGKRGDQGFTFIGSKAFSGKAGELALHGNILEGDVNGDRVADFQIELVGVTSLQASDFYL